MKIKHYLDSTYLKTPEQAGLNNHENEKVVIDFITETIEEHFKLIMVRPDMVALAKKMIVDAGSKVLVGTVIDFPGGQSDLAVKIEEAKQAINDSVDELDYVINYEAFKKGELDKVKNEVLSCTQLGLSNNKIVKWIIEVAALNNHEIVQLTSLIKNIVVTNFKENSYKDVFVKSSTGFYKNEKGLLNGATVPAIILMLENSFPLSVKASGGIKTYEKAMEMIKLGVKRIGTSSAKAIVNGELLK